MGRSGRIGVALAAAAIGFLFKPAGFLSEVWLGFLLQSWFVSEAQWGSLWQPAGFLFGKLLAGDRYRNSSLENDANHHQNLEGSKMPCPPTCPCGFPKRRRRMRNLAGTQPTSTQKLHWMILGGYCTSQSKGLAAASAPCGESPAAATPGPPPPAPAPAPAPAAAPPPAAPPPARWPRGARGMRPAGAVEKCARASGGCELSSMEWLK